MKTVLPLAIAAALLVGCGLFPGPYLTCEDVPTAECEAAHTEAGRNGVFLDESDQVVGAVVRPTEYRLCPGMDELLYDVSFELEGRNEPLIVSVGRTIAGDLIVCTY